MRITASGVGKTLEDAMVKVRAELASGALHSHEIVKDKIGGVEVIDPDKQRKPFDGAKAVEGAVRALASHFKPVDGHVFRVLVLVNDDSSDGGKHSAARIDVDLVVG